MAVGDSHHFWPGRDDCGQRMSRQNTGFFQSLCFVPDGWVKLQIVWDSEPDKFRSDALAPELQELTPTINQLQVYCDRVVRMRVSALKASMTNASKECGDAWYRIYIIWLGSL